MKETKKKAYLFGVAVWLLLVAACGLFGPTFGIGRSLWFMMNAGFWFTIVFSTVYGITYDEEDETWTVL